MADKKRSPWVYVGIGCAVILVLGLIAGIGAVWYLQRAAKRFAAEFNDPVAREAKVKRVLGAETLPPGYQPFIAMSIPMVMDLAILSDHAPRAGGGGNLGERGFLYASVIGGSADDRKDVREYMAGRKQQSTVLARHQVSLAGSEVLSRGEFTSGAAGVSYAVQRGEVEYSGMRQRGLQTFMLFECPNETRNRIGIWFLPDRAGQAVEEPAATPVAEGAAPDDPAAAAEWGEGTAAPSAPSGAPDEAAIRAFVAPFNVCGK